MIRTGRMFRRSFYFSFYKGKTTVVVVVIVPYFLISPRTRS